MGPLFTIKFLACRLSENLVEDINNKLLRCSNMSIQSIYRKASSSIPNAEAICNERQIYKMLKAMFPGIAKSKLKENGVLKLSIKRLKFDTEHVQNISFEELYKFIPQQWKVFENTTKILTVGLLSNEKFNGNSVLMELKIDSNGLLEYDAAGRAIDLSQYLITRTV